MIVNDAGKKTLAYVKVLCLIDGKTDYAMVSGFLCDCEDMWKCACKTKLKTGDMVYVGMTTVINKTIDNTVRRWEEKFKTEEDFKGDKWHTNNTGTIIKKLKLELNTATGMFEHEDQGMICSQCNKEFTRAHHLQKYCSKVCSDDVKKKL